MRLFFGSNARSEKTLNALWYETVLSPLPLSTASDVLALVGQIIGPAFQLVTCRALEGGFAGHVEKSGDARPAGEIATHPYEPAFDNEIVVVNPPEGGQSMAGSTELIEG